MARRDELRGGGPGTALESRSRAVLFFGRLEFTFREYVNVYKRNYEVEFVI